MPQNHDCRLTFFPEMKDDTWCIYEHHLVDYRTMASELIYINACRLIDVYKMTDARNNSDWVKIAQPGDINIALTVRIIMTGDRVEMMNAAVAEVRKHDPMPRCNLFGYSMFGAARPLECSNGREYPSQAEAARLLGLSQSAISEHLAGRRGPVKGYSFKYKESQ